MISPIDLISSASFLGDQTRITFEEVCSSAIHLSLAFLPRQLNYIAAPLFTGLGLLKIFSSPETGKAKENNLTGFIAHLSPISADLIGFYDLCHGMYDLFCGIKDFLCEEKEEVSFHGTKNLLMSAITLFADYRFFRRCHSAQKNQIRGAEEKTERMAANLQRTTQQLDKTSRALGETIFKFRTFRQQGERVTGHLAHQVANMELALKNTESTLARVRRTSERHLQNHLTLQRAMEEKFGHFAREKASAYYALQLAEERIAKLERRLSTLSDQMTEARNRTDATEMKNRRLESLAELLGKALQREKNGRQQLLAATQHEHLAAMQKNILREAERKTSGAVSTHYPTLLLRGVEMDKLAEAYTTANSKLRIAG